MTHRPFEPPASQINRASARRLLWLMLLLVAQAYPQSTGPEFPNPGNAHMSRDEQRTIGLQTAAQVYQQMPILPDNSPETQYIRQLGHKLVATIPPQSSWPFDFHVVAQKEINAFALPGGPMFINIGTITASADEAELAGVMAHEMSHVYMQHSAKQASKAQTTGLFAGLAEAALGANVGGTHYQYQWAFQNRSPCASIDQACNEHFASAPANPGELMEAGSYRRVVRPASVC